MKLAGHRRDWEMLGGRDPLWAVLSVPGKRYGGWDPEEFFATGRREIDRVLEQASAFGLPTRRERALDFGCGVGRLTRAMAGHFVQCRGIDISRTMVQQARRLNADKPQCRFAVNTRPDLGRLPAGAFDFIYSNIVLQHVPDKAIIRRYIGDFLRILRPGGLLVFQLPSRVSLRARLNPRRRLYVVLRAVGMPEEILYNRLRLSPITMNGLPEAEVVALLTAGGGRVLQVLSDEQAGPGNESRTYYVTK